MTAAVDLYAHYKMPLGAPYGHAALVTGSDTVDLTNVCSELFISGTAGNVKVTTLGGETLVIPVPTQFRLQLRCTRVWATGTTATNIVAFW